MTAVQAYNDAAMRWGAAYVIYWNLYDSDPANDFGLFDVNGGLTANRGVLPFDVYAACWRFPGWRSTLAESRANPEITRLLRNFVQAEGKRNPGSWTRCTRS